MWLISAHPNGRPSDESDPIVLSFQFVLLVFFNFLYAVSFAVLIQWVCLIRALVREALVFSWIFLIGKQNNALGSSCRSLVGLQVWPPVILSSRFAIFNERSSVRPLRSSGTSRQVRRWSLFLRSIANITDLGGAVGVILSWVWRSVCRRQQLCDIYFSRFWQFNAVIARRTSCKTKASVTLNISVTPDQTLMIAYSGQWSHATDEEEQWRRGDNEMTWCW